MAEAVCQVGRKHLCTSFAQVETMCTEKIPIFPEEIEIVIETHVTGVTRSGQPSIYAKQPTERCGAGDVNCTVGLFENIKWIDKVLF